MSLAETALQERAEGAEPQAEGINKLPIPGEYIVESSGSPQVPTSSTIAITVEDFKGWFTLDGETLGETTPLTNGDFKVSYSSGDLMVTVQFRQTGLNAEYMFGASVAVPANTSAMPTDDPPITGVWGAEARPPKEEPYPGS